MDYRDASNDKKKLLRTEDVDGPSQARRGSSNIKVTCRSAIRKIVRVALNYSMEWAIFSKWFQNHLNSDHKECHKRKLQDPSEPSGRIIFAKTCKNNGWTTWMRLEKTFFVIRFWNNFGWDVHNLVELMCNFWLFMNIPFN